MDNENKLDVIIKLLSEINDKLDLAKITPGKRVIPNVFKPEIVESVTPKKLTKAELKAAEKKRVKERAIVFQAQHSIKNTLELKQIPPAHQVRAYLATGDLAIFDKNKRAT